MNALCHGLVRLQSVSVQYIYIYTCPVQWNTSMWSLTIFPIISGAVHCTVYALIIIIIFSGHLFLEEQGVHLVYECCSTNKKTTTTGSVIIIA